MIDTDCSRHLCCEPDVRVVHLEAVGPQSGVAEVVVGHTVEDRLRDRSEQDPERLVRLVRLVGLQMTGEGRREDRTSACEEEAGRGDHRLRLVHEVRPLCRPRRGA